jgi:hypothetical protein
MATAQYGGVRDMRALAQRVHRRWLEYRRRNPGMSVPIGDTLSRILEHAPEYQSPRKRTPFRQRPPLQNPGVFTMKEVAATLHTTVGDLLGEPGYTSIRDAISPADRRKLRDAVVLLRKLFDLDDAALGTRSEDDASFFIAPAEFIVRDYDYPEPLHAWLMPDGAPQSLRELRDPRMRVVRVITDSLAPEIRRGTKLVLDTERTTRRDGDLVAVYAHGEGGLLVRWSAAREEQHTIVGTVTMIVEPA